MLSVAATKTAQKLPPGGHFSLTESLTVRRLRAASIVKLILIGSVLGFIALCMLLSVPASVGVSVLKWNGEYVTGFGALLAGPFIGAFVGLFLGLFLAVPVYLGLRIYSLFAGLELEYLPATSSGKAGGEQEA